MIAQRIEPAAVEQSQAYCRRLACSQAGNFRYAIRLLPAAKRRALYTLYAWMRLVDDIADQDGALTSEQRIENLDNWRAWTRAAISGQAEVTPAPSIWPAVADLVKRHGIPPEVFDDAIEGQRQDLTGAGFDTFPQLLGYCHRVAGTVGIASIHIWGFEGGQETIELARDRGVAFQLTNILRDLREDLARGRLYIPREELERLRVREADLRAARAGDGFDAMMRLQIQRAMDYYQRSRMLESRIAPDCRPALAAMTGIYSALLRKIAARPEVVLHRRVSLSILTKLGIAGQAVLTR